MYIIITMMVTIGWRPTYSERFDFTLVDYTVPSNIRLLEYLSNKQIAPSFIYFGDIWHQRKAILPSDSLSTYLFIISPFFPTHRKHLLQAMKKVSRNLVLC